MMTATYDPADNKLRLRASQRLDKETYDRVRAAGFIWAPKQELFVAPMWTPQREDLLLELCGEIGDEDTSLVERSEVRAERFEDYSQSRAEDAERAHDAVSKLADSIPLGQPILVGHHSEKHARKDAKRIENGMRKAVKMWETSQYWKSRAQGAIRAAKYKELPSVRARRIKGLEADKRKEEKSKASAEHCLAFWSGQLKTKNGDLIPVTYQNALGFCNYYEHISMCFTLAEFPRLAPASQYEDMMSMWSALGGSDGEAHAVINVEQARDICLRANHRAVARYDRWIEHLNNRLEYERTMLAASGGTEADKNKPEVGGGCRCWCAPGYGKGWAYIVKVNKVSVTVKDKSGSWVGNTKVPFDKLRAIMSKAEVEAKRAAGLLQESACGRGFYLLDTPPDATTERSETDKPDSPAPKIEAMRESLKQGVQVAIAPSLFPTPPDLARRMAQLAGGSTLAGTRVLEPSAGTGNIVRAIINSATSADCVRVVAVEINSGLVKILEQQRLKTLCANENNFDIREADFMQCNGDLGKFDHVLMNPPFEKGQDIKHILHALTMLKPGGRLVAICANGPRQSEQLKPLADVWEELPEDTFADAGTNVRTVLLAIDKGESE